MYNAADETFYRSMDTAPKNGKIIALRVKDGFGVFMLPKCRWYNGAWVTARSDTRIKPTPIGWKEVK